MGGAAEEEEEWAPLTEEQVAMILNPDVSPGPERPPSAQVPERFSGSDADRSWYLDQVAYEAEGPSYYKRNAARAEFAARYPRLSPDAARRELEARRERSVA